MAKKITLETLAAQIAEGFAKLTTTVTSQGKEIKDLTESVAFVVKHMATKDEVATKQQIVALHGQVNAIEADIRTMKQAKLEARVADLEDEVFGAPKARVAR